MNTRKMAKEKKVAEELEKGEGGGTRDEKSACESENEMESEEGGRAEERLRRQDSVSVMARDCMRCPTAFTSSMAHRMCNACRGCICAKGHGEHAQTQGCLMRGTEKAGWMELNGEIAESCAICQLELNRNEKVLVAEENRAGGARSL